MITLQWIKKNFNIIILGLCILFAALFFQQCSATKAAKEEAKEEARIAIQNYKASNDVVRKEYDKNNELMYSKLSYVTNNLEEVKTLNKDLYDKLIDVNGKPKVYIETRVEYRTKEPIYLTTTTEKISDNDYHLKWNYHYKDAGAEQNLEGYTQLALIKDTSKNCITNFASKETVITKNSLRLGLTVGVKDNAKGDSTEIFVKSLSPNFEVSDIQGVTIIPKVPKGYGKKTHFGVGPNVGISIGPNGEIQPTIGVGIQWNIIKW